MEKVRLFDVFDETMEKIPFVRLLYWKLILWRFRQRTDLPMYLIFAEEGE